MISNGRASAWPQPARPARAPQRVLHRGRTSAGAGAKVRLRDGQVADLASVVGDPRDVVSDLADGPGGGPGQVKLGRRHSSEPDAVELRVAKQSVARLIEVALGEASPVALERDRASEPAVRNRRLTGQGRLDLGQVVEQVVGDPAQRLERGPGVAV